MSTRTHDLVVLMARTTMSQGRGRKQDRRMQYPMWCLGCAGEYRMVAARQVTKNPCMDQNTKFLVLFPISGRSVLPLWSFLSFKMEIDARQR